MVYAVVVVPALVLAYGFGVHWVLLAAGAVLAALVVLVGALAVLRIRDLRRTGIVLSGSRPGGGLVGAGVALVSGWWNRRYVAALRRLP